MNAKGILWIAVIAVAVAVFAGSGSVMGESNNCSRVGTWHGAGDSGTTWMATDTPGSSATVGQFALEWVSIDPTLGGFFPTVTRATNALGVWQKVNEHTYQYTWIAYGLAADGSTVYVARASGIASMADCDHVNLTYVLELFLPTQDISTEPPEFGSFCGTATETRMALVQATCPA
ncbi:MAG TPA: hypothetical protein VLM38_00245 [Blastocatellia bacterium]|nr:hypothetical protein [Blastocatellia bacterium]